MKNKFLTLILCAAVFNFTSCSDDSSPSEPINIVIEGAAVSPEVGGPNEPNQVYVDLSTNTTTAVKRDSWDLGFYSGNEFRVVINGSIYMATAALSETDIDVVNSTSTEVQDLQPQVAVGTFDPANTVYIDAPDGTITNTAIAEVSATDANNKVYLVNLGFAVGTEAASTGGVDISDDSRGWKKIKVLKSGNDYVLQYADLDATTHQEVTISKDSDYNFTFFSFMTETTVNVEPEKSNWDLNFTVFTNEITGAGSYGYADFVVNNTKADAKVYMVDTDVDAFIYEDFALTDVVLDNFTKDQRSVGSSWRNGGGPGSLPSLKENVFYVVSDTDGNLYKLKFLALTNDAGERGYPEFVYSLLQ
ncbi:heme-binding HmuY-like protein [Tenacibaculum adriaticum]|uniref:Heme-binding HmuY-like protein n=1 Tax=Tenacibaculum adriaticum TaxID=413713 RepID=A0A5S5DU99_9FLAO|nr:HmuY family protein [Tenacibaculum adriaticum]TYP99244.1 heme-binding HmuY-like protein [Tenacibaculum adriaticum]